MIKSRSQSLLLHILAGIAFIFSASLLQKLVIGGLTMALQPLGFIAPMVVGILLGVFVYQLQRQYRQK